MKKNSITNNKLIVVYNFIVLLSGGNWHANGSEYLQRTNSLDASLFATNQNFNSK